MQWINFFKTLNYFNNRKAGCPLTIKEVESVLQILPTKQIPAHNSFRSEINQIFKEQIIPILHTFGNQKKREYPVVIVKYVKLFGYWLDLLMQPFFFLIYLFWLLQVLVAARGIFRCGVQALCCGGQAFSLQLWRTSSRACGLCSLRHAGSLVEAHRFSSCGTWAQLPHRMWDLSQFPHQGSNPCPLHWKADSLPLDHQGSPLLIQP